MESIEIFGLVVFMVIFLILILFYIGYKISNKVVFDGIYCRDLLNKYTASEIEFLYLNKITFNSLIAEIFNLVQRKLLIMNKDENQYNFSLSKTNNEINARDKFLLDWLILDFGSDGEFSLDSFDQLKTNSLKSKEFLNKFSDFKAMTSNDIHDRIYKKSGKIQILRLFLVMVFFAGSFGVMVLAEITFNMPLLIIYMLDLLVSFILLKNNLTTEGKELKLVIKAYSKFLNNFGRFDEKQFESIHLWDEHFVNAVTLGKVKEVKRKFRFDLHKDFNQFELYGKQELPNDAKVRIIGMLIVLGTIIVLRIIYG